MLLFLVEAVTLSCIVCILIASGLCYSLAQIIKAPFNFNTQINTTAFAFSAFASVLVGCTPRRRAAKLNPIDALRHE